MLIDKGLLFNTQGKCLNLEVNNEEDCTYVSRVNRECKEFKEDKLTLDMYKCLIFT